MEDNKKFWERMAKFYAPIQEHSNRKLYSEVMEKSKKYLNSKISVLELACGSGQLTLPLCSLAGAWTATDFSEKMIREAEKRCPPYVKTEVQDATSLYDSDGSFDLVLIANALHIMPDPDGAMREIHRVLKDGGILLAPTFVYEGKVNRFRMWMTKLLGFKTYRQWTLAQLRDYLEGFGFECLECELLSGDPLPEGFVALRKKAPEKQKL